MDYSKNDLDALLHCGLPHREAILGLEFFRARWGEVPLHRLDVMIWRRLSGHLLRTSRLEKTHIAEMMVLAERVVPLTPSLGPVIAACFEAIETFVNHPKTGKGARGRSNRMRLLVHRVREDLLNRAIAIDSQAA